MRKQKLANRLMSVVLSVAMVMSPGSFAGMIDVNADTVGVAVSENGVLQDDDSMTPSDESTEKEDVSLDETGVSSEQEGQKAEQSAQQKERQQGQGDGESADESRQKRPEEEVYDDVLEPEQAYDADTPVSELDYITGNTNKAELLDALLWMYNAEREKDEDKLDSSDKLTYGHLQDITQIDFTKYDEATSKASEIQDITGLRYVGDDTDKGKLEYLDVSATGIKKIGDNEFQSHKTLETVIVSDSLEGLGRQAFANCENLKTFKSVDKTETDETISGNSIPSKLNDIDTKSEIFKDCKALEEMTIDCEMQGALQDATSMFAGCSGLKHITIGAGVTVLPIQMFMNAGYYDETAYPDGMTVEIAEGSKLNNIMSSAFQKANMSRLDLSNCQELTKIGGAAFMCVSTITADEKNKNNISSAPLRELVLPAKSNKNATTYNMEIGDEVFYKTQLGQMYVEGEEHEEGYIHIPDYVISVGQASFYKNTSMEDLTLSCALKGIEGYLFYGSESLKSVTVSTDNGNSAIEYINDAAFYNTKNLTDGSFLADMNHLKRIGEKDLGTNVDSVSTEKYENYKNKNDAKVASNVFLGSGLQTVKFPASLRTIMTRAFYACGALTSVEWATDTNLESGAEFTIASEAFVAIEGKPDKSSLPSSLETFYYPATEKKGAKFTIGKKAFSECEKLTVFRKANETVNTLPKTLDSLGDDAFSKCSMLPDIHIKNNESGAAPKLGENGFKDCYLLAEAELPSALTEVPKQFFYDAGLKAFPKFEKGSAISKINESAFFGNKFVTLDLSELKELAEIGNYAFAYYINKDKSSDEFKDFLTPIPLQTVIMPKGNESMKLGDYIFWLAESLNTMKVGDVGESGTVTIPDYIANNQCGAGLFAGTDVSKAHWQSIDTGNNKWSYIPAGMFGTSSVAKLSDACLPAEDLEEIGSGAYANLNGFYGLDEDGSFGLTELDLKPYTKLGKIGSEAFANCFYLKSVKLPDNDVFKMVPDDAFRIGTTDSTVLSGLPASFYRSSLERIDFGSAVELGKNCFAAYHSKEDKTNGIKAGDPVDLTGDRMTLSKVNFGDSKITKIGSGAFRGQTGLKEAQFGVVTEIGDSAFRQCTALNMTQTPIADSVEKIGVSAFQEDSAIGKVTFGSGLKSIGNNAFYKCAVIEKENETDKIETMKKDSGLKELDFKRAQNLTDIGTGAFGSTPIKDFELLQSPVTTLKDSVVGSCLYLQTINLGKDVSFVDANAAYGCVSLRDFKFYSTTTMDQDTFRKEATCKREEETVDGALKYTPIRDNGVTFTIQTSDLVLARERWTKFPYYVNKFSQVSSLKFSEMHIGNAQNTDWDIYKYVKVVADTEGYYVNDTKTENRIEKIAGEENAKNYYSKPENQNEMYYMKGNTKVATFDICGLQATPAGKSIPFTITNDFNFRAGNDVFPCNLTLTFNLTVDDIPYRAVLYNNKNRSEPTALDYNPATGLAVMNREVRLTKSDTTGKMTFYYDIQNIGDSVSIPDNCDLIVKVSDPDMVSVSAGGKLEAGKKDTWLVAAAQWSSTVTTAPQATNGKYFTLSPKKCGDATVTVYPVGSPEKTIVINLHTVSDINKITLSVPTEYKNGYKPGDSFNILDAVTFYSGQSVTKKDGTIGKLSDYTDNRITFTSSRPDIMSVDNAGNVTVKSVTADKTEVALTAVIHIPGGDSVTSQALKCSVAYPPLKSGVQETDAQTGAQVQVTSLPKGTEPGTVTYVKPNAAVKDVVIPDTMTINGATCKVTKIDPSAFKGNKTITTVKIGNNITEIPASAFAGCSTLTSVTIGNSITEIPASAFEGCSALTNVTIPKNVTAIGDKAFYNCKRLKTVSLAAGGALTTIGNQAFGKCAALTKITIPKKVTTIGAKAFYGCSKLKTVTINAKAKLTSIGDSAFYGCKVMKKITIPVNVTTIGAKAFYKCAKLKTITVKTSTLTTVGKSAFKGIHKKAIIKVPKKKLKDYQALLKGKGQAKTVKIKK